MNKKTFAQLKIVGSLAILLLLLAVGVMPADAQGVDGLPLGQPGPYLVGTREMVFVDESRDSRQIETTLWYPAHEAGPDAAPDADGAPYPLILYAHGQTGHRTELRYLTQHLASYGFVVAAMDSIRITSFTPADVIHRPLDVLFVLDQLAALPPDDFSEIIDTDRAGVAGYSFGGYTSVAVSGARMDDTYHRAWCAVNAAVYPAACFSERARAEVDAAYVALVGPQPAEGELRLPFSDERIRAVLPMAGSPGPVFGERGLASATIPMLLMAGTEDTTAPYDWAGVYVYEHWGSSERYLLSFVGAGHLFGYMSTSRYWPAIQHFATAFFGYYLQGQIDYADYLTEDFVNGIEGLAWGPYGDDLGLFNLTPVTPDNVGRIEQVAAFEQNGICTAGFSPAGQLLASGSGGTLTLWDPADGIVVNTLLAGRASVRSAAFSPNGDLVAAASTGNCGHTSVRVWNVASGELLLQRLDDFEHMATSVAFSPDSTMVVAGTGCVFDIPGSASVKVWDITSGTLVLDIAVSTFVRDVAFSPDGGLLAAALGDGTVWLWDAATGAVHTILRDNTGGATSVAFSPDGARLASGGDNPNNEPASAFLWDVASGELLYALEGHTGAVLDVTFSADGRLLVTGGGSHTVMVWDTAAGTALAVREIGPGDNFVYSVALNADSTLLATCEHDEMLRLWGVREP